MKTTHWVEKMTGNHYFVLWPDGQKFGPADVPTLQRWAVENRIGPGTLLEEAGSGRHLRATDLSALHPVLPMSPGFTPQAQFVPANAQSGTTEVTISWVLGAISFLCFGLPAALAGLILGAMALSKKQPSAGFAIALNVVSLAVHTIGCGLVGLSGL